MTSLAVRAVRLGHKSEVLKSKTGVRCPHSSVLFTLGSIADRTELRAAQILSADMTVQDSAGQAP